VEHSEWAPQISCLKLNPQVHMFMVLGGEALGKYLGFGKVIRVEPS
jgi:hypothetical protein